MNNFTNKGNELIPHETFLQRVFPYGFYDDQVEAIVKQREFKPRRDIASIAIKLPMDWESTAVSEDRNWRMQLQGWTMFHPIMNFFDEYENKHELVDYFLEICRDWYKNYKDDPDNIVTSRMPTSYSWYDMSVGFRALCLGFFINRINYHKIAISSDDIELVERLAEKHINNLSCDETFSLNNHGMFQIHGLMSLIQQSTLEAHKEHSSYAIRRMEELVSSQFDIRGIHLEHSPHYHFFAITTFESATLSGWYTDSEIIEPTVTNATNNTKWIVDPNKCPACIGDSILTEQSSVVFPKENLPDRYLNSNFDQSGYSIFRTPWTTPTQYSSYLFFMGAYHRKTHKHRDCLSFEWFDNGHKIIVDGGKYGYKSDIYRSYCLSYRAHNNVEIEGFDIIKCQPYGSCIKENTIDEEGIYITSGMLDYSAIKQTRTIYNKAHEFLIIKDELDLSKEKKVTQRFHLAAEYELASSSNNYLKFKNGEHQLHIHHLQADSLSHYFKGDKDVMEGFCSDNDYKIHPTGTVNFENSLEKGSLITIIALSQCALKDAHSYIEKKGIAESELPATIQKEQQLLPRHQHYRLRGVFYPVKKPATYAITVRNNTFNFLFKPHATKKLLVMLPGAVNKTKPFDFQRSEWLADINCNVISVNDPTITPTNEPNIGWFQGRYHSYAIPDLCVLIKLIARKLNIAHEDVLIFGSSAGGFSALQLADELPNSKVFAINPQIYTNLYNKTHFNRIREYSYYGASRKEVFADYSERIHASIDFSKRTQPVIIQQNTEDSHHLDVHLTPYLDSLPEDLYSTNEKLSEEKKLNIYYYTDAKSGHSPPGKEDSIPQINNLLRL